MIRPDALLPAPLRRAHAAFVTLAEALQPLAQLAARLFVAQVFFLAGLTKLRDWETTLLLFTEEYQVPLLSPAVAAVLVTAGVVLLPVLLVALANRIMRRRGGVGTGWTGMLMAAMAGIAGLLLILEKVRV